MGIKAVIFNLGVYYWDGLGLLCVTADARAAIKWFTRAAEAMQVDAAYNIGGIYAKGGATGTGVAVNLPEAIKWFHCGAEVDFALAQFALGVCYYLGTGVVADQRGAFNRFLRAAKGDQTFTYPRC